VPKSNLTASVLSKLFFRNTFEKSIIKGPNGDFQDIPKPTDALSDLSSEIVARVDSDFDNEPKSENNLPLTPNSFGKPSGNVN